MFPFCGQLFCFLCLLSSSLDSVSVAWNSSIISHLHLVIYFSFEVLYKWFLLHFIKLQGSSTKESISLLKWLEQSMPPSPHICSLLLYVGFCNSFPHFCPQCLRVVFCAKLVTGFLYRTAKVPLHRYQKLQFLKNTWKKSGAGSLPNGLVGTFLLQLESL